MLWFISKLVGLVHGLELITEVFYENPMDKINRESSTSGNKVAVKIMWAAYVMLMSDYQCWTFI